MSFIESLFEELEAQLKDAGQAAENILQRAERSVRAAKLLLAQLKEYVLEHGFADQAEEIRFFKQVKPLFLKQMIFFTELYSFEEKRPLAAKEGLIAYHQDAIARLRLFFSRHERMYTYYRLGRTDLDERYFLRASAPEEDSPELDSRFCTAASYELSKILALEAFLVHLTSELHILEHGHTLLSAQVKDKSPLVWTDSKVSFIELVYALQSSGSVNNGKISVAQMMEILGQALQIDPGNYYAVFQQNIRIRKKRRTVYLDFLTEKLEARMDESDEHPRYK